MHNKNIQNHSNYSEINKNFSILEYFPKDELNTIERKILNRIDVELGHRNPNNIKMNVSSDFDGKYSMNFSNGVSTIQSSCSSREKCFDKLKNFILSLKEIPIAGNN